MTREISSGAHTFDTRVVHKIRGFVVFLFTSFLWFFRGVSVCVCVRGVERYVGCVQALAPWLPVTRHAPRTQM